MLKCISPFPFLEMHLGIHHLCSCIANTSLALLQMQQKKWNNTNGLLRKLNCILSILLHRRGLWNLNALELNLFHLLYSYLCVFVSICIYWVTGKASITYTHCCAFMRICLANLSTFTYVRTFIACFSNLYNYIKANRCFKKTKMNF